MPDLLGFHHITAITGDAPRNVDFYCRVMGMRMVKKTVNFDAPEVYHLYYADEVGTPGSVLTFFEFPGARRGQAGAGMIHRVGWHVGGQASLDFWGERLSSAKVPVDRDDGSLRFIDPEGLGLELVADGSSDTPLRAVADDIPAEYALLGFSGVRSYAARPKDSGELLLGLMGFTDDGGVFRHNAPGRGAAYHVDPPPSISPIQGAGSVHHVAWASADADHESWRQALAGAEMHPTPIIDRTYFRSIYFREPSGVLFEIATLSPGFDVDENAASLGEALVLPQRYEVMRPWLEKNLTPITNPRSHGPESEDPAPAGAPGGEASG
ncbi:MAG TPA: VOC family protein [Candidatus Solibacter sp.]|jgi:glyoxalase family protein|nr:VOC family protein [Candidatus Solibacter sp.]